MIPLFKIHRPIGVGDAIERVFASGIIAEGEVCDAFEKTFGEFVGNPYTALVNSATSALTLAYRMCDVKPGSEVISTPITCMATNEPIVNAGATIRWADVEPDTGNISVDSVEELINDRTRAIVAVHWAGQPFDIDELCALGRKHSVPVIADAAHALGATYKGKKIATMCEYTAFSFQAIKHLTTGDGGALSSRAKLHHERIKLLRWFGIDRRYTGPKWEQDIIECGYKFHMNDIAASIGMAQMPSLPEAIAAHMRNGHFFDESVIDTSSVSKLKRPLDRQSAHWVYSILVDDPDHFKKYMLDRGVAVDRVHIRNDHYSVFDRFRRDGELHGVDFFSSRLINIPVGWWLTNDDLKTIVGAVNEYRL